MPQLTSPFSPSRKGQNAASVVAATLLAALVSLLLLSSCGGGGGTTQGSTSGGPFSPTYTASAFHEDAVEGSMEAGVDTSCLEDGYVGAVGQSGSRLKFQVSKDGQSYNYDLPNDGTPIICPLNMGDGAYTFTVFQNTSESRYVALFTTSADVAMYNEAAPYLVPSFYCDYNEGSACVARARELTAGAQNQGDAVAAVYNYIVSNISYDSNKASQLADSAGYVPNPDATLASGTGICFDYSSLAAAMLRSVGIPCQIVTGNVSPNNVYHAWNMVYIDGTWQSVSVSVESNTWSRIDTTFAAGGASSFVGDGASYADRYVY